MDCDQPRFIVANHVSDVLIGILEVSPDIKNIVKYFNASEAYALFLGIQGRINISVAKESSKET